MIGTLQYSVRLVRSITEEVKLWKGRALAMSLAADDDSSGMLPFLPLLSPSLF